MILGGLQACFGNLSICHLWTASIVSLMVNRSFAAPSVNTKVVNRSAPELFPLTLVLNNHFIPAAITSRRA